ncbi:MAG: EAL domain-containing protein [Sphingomonas fennica]
MRSANGCCAPRRVRAAAWPAAARVAVNVSPIQFGKPGFPAIVASALAESGLAPERLELEITESVFLGGAEGTALTFDRLKGLGVRLALDDFGTGYSSLGYLKSAPFDKIKIDQSFVRGASIAGNRNIAIIKAIVTLADALGMETTAEGVEAQNEIDLIRELGCSHIQGFVYGRPMDGAAVVQQLGGATVVAPTGVRVSRAPRTRCCDRCWSRSRPPRPGTPARRFLRRGDDRSIRAADAGTRRPSWRSSWIEGDPDRGDRPLGA